MSDLGEKPLLQWISLKDLFVDESYQRSIKSRRSQRMISAIARDFQWPLFGALLVSRRGKVHAVVDGQHRMMAARAQGKIESVPCVVVKFDDIQQETKAFVGANKKRIGMTGMSIYHASVVAGDEKSLALARVLKKSGVTIPKMPQYEGCGPKETYAVTTLLSAVAKYGEDIVHVALTAITEAYPDRPALRSNMIKSLILIYSKHGGDVDRDDLLDTLERIDPAAIEFEALEISRETGRTTTKEMADIIIGFYNQKSSFKLGAM